MKVINVRDLNSGYALSLYSVGSIGENVEIREIKNFDWGKAKEEILKDRIISDDMVDDIVERMRKDSIPCKIVNNRGEELENPLGIMKAFYADKKDVKEFK